MVDKQYLAKHRIPELINNVVILMAEARPADPRTFLANAILDTSEIDTGFPHFTAQHTNLLAKYLTAEIYNKLKNRRSASGFTLDRAIQPGVDILTEPGQANPTEPPYIGIIAGDEDCYATYAEVFDPIIAAYHQFVLSSYKYREDLNHTKLNGSLFDDLYVLSCRISASRNIRGFGLLPFCTRRERRDVEAIIQKACKELHDQLTGEYVSHAEMPDDYKVLTGKGLVYTKPCDEESLSSCINRDWPDARAVKVNTGRTFAVWVNIKDHLKVVSLQNGGQMRQVFERFCTGLSILEEAIEEQGHHIMRHPRLGNLTTSPANIGASTKVSVHIRLANLIKHPKLPEMLQKYRLCIRQPAYAIDDTVYEVYNTHKLGMSELELVQEVADGIAKLVQYEKALASGRSDELRSA